MAPTLYLIKASPPVRGVLMTARAINLELERKEIDLFGGEHLKPEFLKINPQHTLPTLVDGDFILWDSHAIIAYLVQKYGKNDALYPKNLEKRAVVDQRLHFDSGVLFPVLGQLIPPILKGLRTSPDPEVVKKVLEVYEFLESFLKSDKWIAGDSVTIADFSIASTFSSLEFIVPASEKKYPLLSKWFQNVQKLDAYEANKEGLGLIKELVLSKLKA